MICFKRKTTYPTFQDLERVALSSFAFHRTLTQRLPHIPVSRVVWRWGTFQNASLLHTASPEKKKTFLTESILQVYYINYAWSVMLISTVHVQGASRFIIGYALSEVWKPEKPLYCASTSHLFFSPIFLFSIHFINTLQTAPISSVVNSVGQHHLLLLLWHSTASQSVELIYLEKNLCTFLGVEQRL